MTKQLIALALAAAFGIAHAADTKPATDHGSAAARSTEAKVEEGTTTINAEKPMHKSTHKKSHKKSHAKTNAATPATPATPAEPATK